MMPVIKHAAVAPQSRICTQKTHREMLVISNYFSVPGGGVVSKLTFEMPIIDTSRCLTR